MSEKHDATCQWNIYKGYRAWTPYGEIKMFEEGGHKAVEIMLLSAAACLDFYLVEYVKARELSVTNIEVTTEGEISQRPERVSKIITRVKIEGDVSDKERKKMVTICERACKVMNTMKVQPDVEVVIELGND